MGLAPRLELRQSQQLVMTPQLQQAIKLLQLSNLDLTAYVEQELEQNPLLERRDALASENDISSDKQEGDVNVDTDIEAPALDDLHLSDATALPETTDSQLDTDYDNTFSDTASDAPEVTRASDSSSTGLLAATSGGSGNYSGTDFNLENMVAEEESFHDFLMQQVNISFHDTNDKFIAAYLVDLVSDSGYFTEDTDEIADILGCPALQIENILTLLRTFEPSGVFASGLADCLALQLKEKNRYDPAIAALLENLPMLADGDMKGLLSVCKIDLEDLTEMIAEIRELDPKPGHRFANEVTRTVIPDIFVRKSNDGSWLVELNSETLPRVLVNNSYHAVIRKKIRNQEEKTYVTDCLNSANWLIKSLDQRANTILKVATELVKHQEAFFIHGVQFLRPLNLKTIADAISMHESTVSRVTANKYLATSRGIFELKYFFTSSINSTKGGDAHSAVSVKYHIKSLIDEESPSAILSDDKLVIILKDKNIDIARRTVAKYREAMGISSSVQRRRQKKKLLNMS